MKKLTLFSAVMLMICLVFSTAVSAAEGDIQVYIDNEPVVFDVPPQLINDRTMVPMRAIFEQLGATVTWDDATKTATGTTETTVVTVTINSTTITINGVAQTMDVAPQIVDSRTLVPVRFISEAFACTVEWDGVNRIVYISTTPVQEPTEVVTEIATEVVEEVTEEPTEIITEIVTEVVVPVEYSYYKDSLVAFPTYDSVTGAAYVDYAFSDETYAFFYEYTDDADVEFYLDALVEEGWAEYSSDYDSSDNTQRYYYVNGECLIGIIVQYSEDEVWILYMAPDYYAESDSSDDYEFYDAEVDFPTYDSVTGSRYKNFYPAEDADDFNIAAYEYVDADTFYSYIYALRDDYGWKIYDTKSDDVNFTYTVYMYKGNTLIAIVAELKYDEVWILYR